jgi:hypothetical protein
LVLLFASVSLLISIELDTPTATRACFPSFVDGRGLWDASLRWLDYWIHRRRRAAELSDEIQHHREQQRRRGRVPIGLAGFLFEVTAEDPLTFVAVPGLFATVAAAACATPAYRATQVDPITTLRAE